MLKEKEELLRTLKSQLEQDEEYESQSEEGSDEESEGEAEPEGGGAAGESSVEGQEKQIGAEGNEGNTATAPVEMNGNLQTEPAGEGEEGVAVAEGEEKAKKHKEIEEQNSGVVKEENHF